MKKRKRRKPGQNERAKQLSKAQKTAEKGPAAVAGSPVPVRLQAIALRVLLYNEVVGGEAIAPSQQPPMIGLETSMNAILNITDSNLTELRINYRVRPDKRYRPVEVEVHMSALFERDADVPLREALNFASRSGGLILYPYIREAISSVTSRGIFQPILIAPIPLGELFPSEKLDELEAKATVGMSVSASTG